MGAAPARAGRLILAWTTGYSELDLERFGRRHTPDFAVADLADRLGAIVDLNDRGFAAYGLDEKAISDLRSWAAGWEANLRTRPDFAPGPQVSPEPDWDAYLGEA